MVIPNWAEGKAINPGSHSTEVDFMIRAAFAEEKNVISHLPFTD